MVIFLWFAAMVVTTSASQEFLQFRRQQTSDDVHGAEIVGCNKKMDEQRKKIMEETNCALSEVYLGLLPASSHQSINPNALWVKRCVGGCLHTEYGFTCRPIETVTRNISVTINDTNTGEYFCSTFTLEEHVICQCHSDDPVSCAADKILLDLDPFPEDTKSDPDRAWIKRCSGGCGLYESNCMPDSVTNKELRGASGVYTAEEHETCRCTFSELPCAPVDTIVPLPANFNEPNPLGYETFFTKRCSGGCASENFKCTAVKTVIKTIPNITWELEEEVTCACVKQPDV